MLYYSTQAPFIAFDGATLTAAFAGNRKAFETGGFSKASFNIAYAMGATETGNTIEFQLEASHNGTDWFSLIIDDTASVSTITDRVWTMAPGSRNVLVDIAYRHMRMSLKETGVTTNFGTASVAVTLSGL